MKVALVTAVIGTSPEGCSRTPPLRAGPRTPRAIVCPVRGATPAAINEQAIRMGLSWSIGRETRGMNED